MFSYEHNHFPFGKYFDNQCKIFVLEILDSTILILEVNYVLPLMVAYPLSIRSVNMYSQY